MRGGTGLPEKEPHVPIRTLRRGGRGVDKFGEGEVMNAPIFLRQERTGRLSIKAGSSGGIGAAGAETGILPSRISRIEEGCGLWEFSHSHTSHVEEKSSLRSQVA